MKNLYYLWMFSILMGCDSVDFNDPEKRNEKYGWFIEKSTGIGEWVLLGNNPVEKDGSYILFYYNGKIWEKGKIENGKHIDTVAVFDLDENIVMYKIYQSDTVLTYYVNNGDFEQFYPTGELKEEGVVLNHEQSGNWKSYYRSGILQSNNYELNDSTIIKMEYHSNGNVQDSFALVNGLIHGISKYWYENGRVRHIAHWKNGFQDSTAVLYFKSGEIMERSDWKNNQRDGRNIGYFKSGGISYKHPYKNGMKHGNDTSYFENGNLRVTGLYENGQREGTCRTYYLNGEMYYDALYEGGKLHGPLNRYNYNGDLFQIDYFNNGVLDSVIDVKELNEVDKRQIDMIIEQDSIILKLLN